MGKLDPTVRKETEYIAVWTLALSLGMEAVFLALRAWSFPVLAGNLAGAAAAVGNYLLLGITVAKAVSGPADQAARKIRASMTLLLRSIMELLWWLTIAGGVAALAGGVMAFKKA